MSKGLEMSIKIMCIFDHCHYESSKYGAYVTHISRFHRFDLGKKEIKENLVCSLEDGDFLMLNARNSIGSIREEEEDFSEFLTNEDIRNKEDGQNENNCSNQQNELFEDDIKNLYMMKYLEFYSFHLVPKNVCDKIFETVLFFIKINNQNIVKIIEECNKNYQNTQGINVSHFIQNENIIGKTHEILKTDLKKEQWKKESIFYVRPIEICIKSDKKFHYVPILDKLKSILSKNEIYESITKQSSNNSRQITSFNDSNNFKNNLLFNSNEFTIQIKLFIDDFNLFNPLGDNRKKNRLTGIYFRVGNLPNLYQSADYFTQLALLFDSNILDEFVYSKILERFINDLKKLENEGLEIMKNEKLLKFRGTLSFICADNLGANKIGGFVESFQQSVKGYCRFCYGDIEFIQENFKDSDFKKRTPEEYEKDLTEKQNGIKTKCAFNQLSYFHCINGLPPDIMHNFLEGVLVYEFGLLMNYLNSIKFLSVKELNESLEKFNYNRNDLKNKIPNNHFTSTSLKTKYGFKLSATHFWTLIRIFPLIYGESLKDDEVFLNFILLVEIFRDLNGTILNEELILSIEERIDQYLKTLKLLHGINLTAKHHMIIHSGRCIRDFGPPHQYSTMRFESTHKKFKNIYERTNNSINVTKSLATRHQNLQLFYFNSENYFKDCEYGPETQNNSLYSLIKDLRGRDVIAFKWVNLNGIEYYEDFIIVIKKNNTNLPIFGKIDLIYSKNNKLFFMVYKLKTLCYLEHFLGFHVVDENTERLHFHLTPNELKNNFHPLSIYLVDGQKIVQPKYPIEE
ncbi:unnamed protein product [Brachionus calyciflorus]|uniref:Uncharacterized protein n=1 Tax=Brachionus calyciflorus TaxID=104777 RepID=A0A813SGK7_9BILA|nr:unnamed protein product [Brachionus calyciflorus]